MTRVVFVIFILSLGYACQKESEVRLKSTISDDYVLIEFAARLEEDYYRLHPEESKNSLPTP